MYRDSRLCGRLVAFLHKRLSQIDFNRVQDPRGRQGKRWSLAVLLKSGIVGMASGQKSLADLEEVTSSFSSSSRRVFPCGVVAIDGKWVATSIADSRVDSC